MSGPVGGHPDELGQLAVALDRDRRALEHATADALGALAVLRASPVVGGAAVGGAGAGARLTGAIGELELLVGDVVRTTRALEAADRWVCAEPAWWTRPAELVRSLDGLGLQDVPGLGWLDRVPAVELRTATRDAWDLARAVDGLGAGRLEAVLAELRGSAVVRIGRIAAAAERVVGGRAVAVRARVRDVAGSPLVSSLREGAPTARTVLRAVGRGVTVVAMVADGADAADEFAEGDAAAGWRSVAEVAAGAMLLTPTPATQVAGLVVIGGIYAYEQRDAIAATARSGWRATTRAATAAGDAATRAGDAVSEALDDVVDGAVEGATDAARAALEGARRVLDGLF